VKLQNTLIIVQREQNLLKTGKTCEAELEQKKNNLTQSAKGADFKLNFLMKKLLLVIMLLTMTTLVFGQFKIAANGDATFGTNNYNYKLTISPCKGTSQIDYHTEILQSGMNLPLIQFKAIGGVYNYSALSAQFFFEQSDRTAKENILPLEKAMPILKQINAYSYNLKTDIRETRQKEYGVLAQEVEEVLPGLVLTTVDSKFVKYSGFIPFLIEAAKEQQNEIEMLQQIIAAKELDLIELKALRNEFAVLQEMVSKCCNEQGILKNEESQPVQERAVLYQNTPNPFTSNTEIVCNLPNTAKNATLYIHNLQGIELKAYSITQTGLTTITVSGSELPAGMYLYTLVVNNEIVDTKRMILTK